MILQETIIRGKLGRQQRKPTHENASAYDSGYVGKYLKVTVQPKHNISDPGPEVQAVSAKPIAIADIRSTTVSPNFRNFVSENSMTLSRERLVDGVLGTWVAVCRTTMIM